MNAIVEKIKNRSYFHETDSIASEDVEIVSSELEKEKRRLVLAQKKQNKTAMEQHIDDEIKLMLGHIRRKSNNTEEIPTDDLKLSQKIEWHGQLQKVIAPASLKSIKYATRFCGDFPTGRSFFKFPLAKYFFGHIILMAIVMAVGFCTKETRLFTGYYSFELTDTAVLYFIKSYGISTACLGNLLYLTAKLSRQIHDVTLTSERIPFYRNSLLFGLMASSFIAFKIPELLLIELTPIGYLFIGLIAGLLIDILNLIFKE